MSSWVMLLARTALAGVFAMAAGAKLADRAGVRRAAAELGVPRVLVSPVAVLLPATELVVAVALVWAPSARLGAGAALVLLLAFSGVIAANLARGHSVQCRCFGNVHSSSGGAAGMVRNAVLGALSALVLWRGAGVGLGTVAGQIRESPASAVPGVIVVIGLLVLSGVEALLIAQLMHQQGRLLLRLELLERSPTGDSREALRQDAPDFTLPSAAGEFVNLTDLLADQRPALLVFTSAGCRPCTSLFPEIGRWQREYANHLTVAVVAGGDAVANRVGAIRHGVARVLLDRDGAVADAFGTSATPTGVLIAGDGRLGSAARGADAIRALVVRTVDGYRQRPPHRTTPLRTPSTPLMAPHPPRRRPSPVPDQ